MNCRVTGTHDERSNALAGLKLSAIWTNGGTPRTPRPAQYPAVRKTRSWISEPVHIPSRTSQTPAEFGPAHTMNAPVSGKRFEVSCVLATSATKTGVEQMTKSIDSNTVIATEGSLMAHLTNSADRNAASGLSRRVSTSTAATSMFNRHEHFGAYAEDRRSCCQVPAQTPRPR